MPKVSIITPTYNHEAFIGPCIESVLAQTESDWEMWIMDDGSTDGTADVAESYADPRLHVIRQQNRGLDRLKETYNDALAPCTGEVIAILEGDDLWPADKLALQLPDFDDQGVVLSSGVTLGDLGGTRAPIHKPILSASQLTNTPVGAGTAALCHPTSLTFTFPVSTIIRRSALEKIGGFQQPTYLPLVDLPTLLPISTLGRFAWHDEPVGIWRRHAGSATGQKFSLILDGARRLVVDFLEAHPGCMTPEDEARVRLDWDVFTTQRFLLLARSFKQRGMKDQATQAVNKARETAHTRNQKIKITVARAVLALGLPWDSVFALFGAKDWDETTDGGDRFIRDTMIDP